MYVANPIALYGVVIVVLGIIFLGWRRLARREHYRSAADLAVKVAVAWGLFFAIFGAVLGFFHAGAHAECQSAYAAAPNDSDQWKGCQYFFDHYGGGPAQ